MPELLEDTSPSRAWLFASPLRSGALEFRCLPRHQELPPLPSGADGGGVGESPVTPEVSDVAVPVNMEGHNSKALSFAFLPLPLNDLLN